MNFFMNSTTLNCVSMTPDNSMEKCNCNLRSGASHRKKISLFIKVSTEITKIYVC